MVIKLIFEVRENKIESKNIIYNDIFLKNNLGMEMILSSLGAGIKSIKVNDKDGISKEMTLCPTDEELFYFVFHGKTIGRTSGRIKDATFEIDGKVAHLDKNNFNTDNLHGGREGLHKKNFRYNIIPSKDYIDVKFSYFSKDQENGYFGNVNIVVTYRFFNEENKCQIIFEGTTDCKTLLNLTNHAYFNLSGDPFTNVNNHVLYIGASKYGALSKHLIVEKKVPVTREMDFRTPHMISDFIDKESLHQVTNGYDHPYFLDHPGLENLAASLYSKESGIKLEVRTSYPCVVFYSSGKSNKPFIVNGIDYSLLSSCCLECQFHPDGIHQEKERNGVFSTEKPYREIIQYEFILER